MAVLVTLLVAGAPAAARAQGSIGFGGGGSIDPEQGFVGVFFQSRDVGGGFRFRGGIDGGFGNGLRVATVNIDFIYLLPLGQSPWRFVTGGGPAISITKFSDEELIELYGDPTDVSAGYSYLFGIAHDGGFFTEVRLGGGNVPSMKYLAGWQIKFQ
jgi:hypothetical protein